MTTVGTTTPDNVQVPFKGHEVLEIIDALSRVQDAILKYEKPMFLGAPVPSKVLGDVKTLLEDRLKEAAGRLQAPAVAR